MDCKNGMQAKPDKFHFMLFSPTPAEQQVCNYTTARPGCLQLPNCPGCVYWWWIAVKIVCFSQHISACCKKAARQLNALVRICKDLNINSRIAISNSFIMSNFYHCPLVWYFCGQVNDEKLEMIQERALWILFADYNFSYMELLEKSGTTTRLIHRLCIIALTVSKFCMMTLSNGNVFCVTGPFVRGIHRSPSVTRSFDVFFDLHLNKGLSKQSRRQWFETPSHPLWRHCNGCHLLKWWEWISYIHVKLSVKWCIQQFHRNDRFFRC